MPILLLPGGINPSIHAPHTIQEASVCQSRETGFLHQCHMAWLLLSNLFPRSNCGKNGPGYSQGPKMDLCFFFHSRYRAFIAVFQSCDAQMTEYE